MKKMFFLNTPSYKFKASAAFTLIELVVAITILSVIMLSVFMVYSNLIQINKRLEAMRIIQENIRNITEQMASDIREKWIDFSFYNGSPWHESNNYTGSGNTVLAIKWGNKYYAMTKNNLGTIVQCDTTDIKNPLIHCYIGKEDNLNQRKAISDDRVRIENLHFFLSGNTGESLTNLSQEWKATITLSLGIENKVWMSSEIVKSTHMLIETTISEKVYKQNSNSIQ